MTNAFPDFTPVTLLTGFLGSGKTTLLRRLLTDPAALERCGADQQEFGEVGLDHACSSVSTRTWCCCNPVAFAARCGGTGRCDPRSAFEARARHRSALRPDRHREHGACRSFSRSFHTEGRSGVAASFQVLGRTCHGRCRQCGDTACRLIASRCGKWRCADVLVLTKADIAEAGQVAQVTAMIRQINPDAPIVLSTDDVFDVIMLLEDTTTGRAEAMQSPGGFYCDDPGPRLAGEHSGGIRSFVLVSEGTVDWTAFGIWLTTAAQPARRPHPSGQGHSQHQGRRLSRGGSRGAASGPSARPYAILARRGPAFPHRLHRRCASRPRRHRAIVQRLQRVECGTARFAAAGRGDAAMRKMPTPKSFDARPPYEESDQAAHPGHGDFAAGRTPARC